MDDQETGKISTGVPDSAASASLPGDSSVEPVREMAFPAVARLELDELLAQLIDRAQDVIETQSRLRGLLRATRTVIADLSLEVVLRRIVEEACQLVDARYGALGVIAREGHLEQFIHVGMEPPLVEKIGQLPRGQGVLGLLTAQPQPLRLNDIATNPRAVGFPANHPPMQTFLGVPIRVRSEVFGNLYLTEKRNGRTFTAEDEELVLALAASAGIAIDNARLFDQAQRRQRWLQASADITRHVLGDGERPLNMIVSRARELAGADVAAILLSGEPSSHLTVEVADGDDAGVLQSRIIPMDGSLGGKAVRTCAPLLVSDAAAEASGNDPYTHGIGPLMIVPLAGSQVANGAVVLGRRHGATPFTDSDLDMAAAFAGHVATALEITQARAARERIVVLEDRDRIARDLHDHVMQRLYAVALGMQGLAAAEERPGPARRMATYVEDLDVTIREIRSTVFELRGRRTTAGSGLRARVASVVDAVSDAFGFAPYLRFEGPLDTAVDAAAGEHLLAVVREGLSNAARHARASSVEVIVGVTGGQLSVDVIDNGVGIGNTERRSGLANIRSRAEDLGGTFDLSAGPEGGTHLRWSVPLA
ncbi:GAF domain-containing sensor histidine kinase [Protofrankia coriariae]|uniref:Histidine kinase n=1 Tax=Protofrankia coriariae TaxID=1562887 RepID=A0ABR5F287_9ACTN|nr:GAF domain-containing sensor histidine kinase [Protofrankia coriariae]KLL10798.1 histidine kinase [Protofrankia coriariae]